MKTTRKQIQNPDILGNLEILAKKDMVTKAF